MEQLDYIIILLYFLGLIAVSVVMSRKIKKLRGYVYCRAKFFVVAVGSLFLHDYLLGKYLCRLGRRCL